MRPRKVRIVVDMLGMKMPVATVTIQQFAKILQPETELRCPACDRRPAWHGGYECECGATYRHWSQLKRVVKGTGELIVKQKFTDGRSEVEASAYIMDMEDFSRYVDATLQEYGVTVRDETSARNLRKLLIATDRLGKVILIRFRDTYEERIAVLTLSISNRIILKELIPLNLADIKETVKVNLKEVTPEDLAEAEQFVKMLPKAREELLKVKDYRIIGIEEKIVSEKVLELEKIIAKAKQTA